MTLATITRSRKAIPCGQTRDEARRRDEYSHQQASLSAGAVTDDDELTTKLGHVEQKADALERNSDEKVLIGVLRGQMQR